MFWISLVVIIWNASDLPYKVVICSGLKYVRSLKHEVICKFKMCCKHVSRLEAYLFVKFSPWLSAIFYHLELNKLILAEDLFCFLVVLLSSSIFIGPMF
jgi:hypothetical protein